MLKTNSKKARENVRAYIIEHFDPTGYDVNQQPETFTETARIILDVFESEKHYSIEYIKTRGISMQYVFEQWAAGLPSILDTCYYYNRSAVADVAKILEQDETTTQRYDESSAEKLLTYLIYRELVKGATK